MFVEVNKKNLLKGIRIWRLRKWEPDLADSLYIGQAQLLVHGASQDWWEKTVPTLAAWLALRPLSKADIFERGLKLLPDLNAAFLRLRSSVGFESVQWSTLEELFEIAWSIKNVNSPVFASKLCHFMRPDLYVVIDQEVVGVTGPYSAFWKACSAGWRRAEPVRQELKEILLSESGAKVSTTFPFPTKIAELCAIGARA